MECFVAIVTQREACGICVGLYLKPDTESNLKMRLYGAKSNELGARC